MKWLCEVSHEAVESSACLQCALQRRKPGCQLDYAVLKAIEAANQPDDTVEALRQVYPVIRVTSLTGCLRKAWYQANGFDEDLVPPSVYWARTRGTIFHEYFERYLGGVGMVEKRLTYFVRQVEAFVSGRVDFYNLESGALVDFKTIALKKTWRKSLSRYAVKYLDTPYDSHVQQLSIYSWLLTRSGYPVNSMRLVYMSMDHSQVFDVPVPDVEAVETSVIEKLQTILAARQPDAEAGWLCKYCTFGMCEHNQNDNIQKRVDNAAFEEALDDLYG